LDDPELDARDPFTRMFLVAEYWKKQAIAARRRAQKAEAAVAKDKGDSHDVIKL
jgi:hypothetical protein